MESAVSSAAGGAVLGDWREAGRVPEANSARGDGADDLASADNSGCDASREVSRTPNARAKRGAGIAGAGSARGAGADCGGISMGPAVDGTGVEVAVAEVIDGACVGLEKPAGDKTSGRAFAATTEVKTLRGVGIALAGDAGVDAGGGA